MLPNLRYVLYVLTAFKAYNQRIDRFFAWPDDYRGMAVVTLVRMLH